MGNSLENTVSWGNTAFSLRWNHAFSGRLFSNLTLYRTQYFFKEEYFNEILEPSNLAGTMNNKLTSGVQDLAFKGDFDYFLYDKVKLNFGFKSGQSSFVPNDVYTEVDKKGSLDIGEYSSKMNVLENVVYAELDVEGKRFDIRGGIRGVSYYMYQPQEGVFNFIEPRLKAGTSLSESVHLNYSFTVMNQFAHLLTFSGAGFPSDYWMPSNQNVSPSKGIQNALGLTFHQKKYLWRVETYIKQSNNLIHFKPGESFIGNLKAWDQIVYKDGKGIAYGVELFLQKTTGRLTGWFSLTLSRSLVEFEELNKGNRFPFKYDRPIAINVVGIYQVNKKIDFSFTWKYGRGYPVTLAEETYVYGNEDYYVYGDVNSYRMRDYHRLDLSMNHTKKLKWGEQIITVSIFNLYNRQNPYFYYYEHETTPVMNGGGMELEKGDLKLFQQSLFSFFPSIGYSLKF